MPKEVPLDAGIGSKRGSRIKVSGVLSPCTCRLPCAASLHWSRSHSGRCECCVVRILAFVRWTKSMEWSCGARNVQAFMEQLCCSQVESQGSEFAARGDRERRGRDCEAEYFRRGGQQPHKQHPDPSTIDPQSSNLNPQSSTLDFPTCNPQTTTKNQNVDPNYASSSP